MEINMLRRALWVFLRPLIQLITNLINPEIGEMWLVELNKFLRKEPCWVKVASGVTPSTPTDWAVDNEGNIHFILTSNGMTREQWEQDIECRGLRIGDDARQVLRRASGAPTNGVTHNIVVRPWKSISYRDRVTEKIRAAADKKGWLKPHWEVACLIRVAFTDEQLEAMGLWYIVTMHEPINDSNGDPSLLSSSRLVVGRWLDANYDRPGDRWADGGGFAFDESNAVRNAKA